MARMPGEQSLEAESEEPKPSPTCASGDTSWPSICLEGPQRSSLTMFLLLSLTRTDFSLQTLQGALRICGCPV